MVSGVSQSGVQARVRLVGPDANSSGVAKNVIEVQGPNGVQWIEGTRANAKQYGLNPTLFSQQGAEAAWRDRQSSAERRQGVADARRYKEADLQIRQAESGARVDSVKASAEATRAKIAQDQQQLDDTRDYNQGALGVSQYNADTNRIQVTSEADYKSKHLTLQRDELQQRGQQFDQSHLLNQQQAAMNYNLGVHALNERMDNAEQDRRLRTMEGIGAAIAGLAAMIGG